MRTTVDHAMERLARARPFSAKDSEDILSTSEENDLLARIMSDDAVVTSMSPRTRHHRRTTIVVIASVAAIAVALVVYVSLPSPKRRRDVVWDVAARWLLQAKLETKSFGTTCRCSDVSNNDRVLSHCRSSGVEPNRPWSKSSDPALRVDGSRCNVEGGEVFGGHELRCPGVSRRQCERLPGRGATRHQPGPPCHDRWWGHLGRTRLTDRSGQADPPGVHVAFPLRRYHQ
jgi:hypothetical protein